MRTIEDWKQIILTILLAELEEFIPYKEIRKLVASHYDTNMDVTLEILENEDIIVFQRKKGEPQYKIDDTQIEVAQKIANGQVNSESQPEIVQPYMPDPKGYTYWKEITDYRKLKRRSTYVIYHKQNDPLAFKARIITRSSPKPRSVKIGHLHNPKDIIAISWRNINELVKNSADGTFYSQQLHEMNLKYCKNNSRQTERIVLTIFKELGWIEVVEMVGNSPRYKISGQHPHILRIDDYVDIPEENIVNDPETWETPIPADELPPSMKENNADGKKEEDSP